MGSCPRDLCVDGKTATIPERYIRRDQDPTIVVDAPSLPEIPVIDFAKLKAHEESPELQRLHAACKDWGFFQLVNHRMSPSLMEAIKRGTVELFDLPEEERSRYEQKVGEMEGFGRTFVVSDDQKLDWADVFHLYTLPRSLRKPHLFSELPLPYRDDLDAYSEETKKLAVELLRLMGKALGMDSREVSELFEEGIQGMRMNYYPPCPQPELVIGLSSHSDADAITILHQVNETEGLQIQKDGVWIPVRPLPGAFIINVGDIVEMVTNGIYRSINHRATVNTTRERVTVASFYSPRMEAVIGPAPSLVTADNPAQFRRITVAEHLNGYLTSELKGKAYLDSMRIQK
ncbi:hypothetical protein MLD38_037112 [Melastoma candidum]|uniref:Uncharacterized protein n=1 Tax=Melastoma candidum TaxID=119954 RepID=A0ACB9LL35_9MYRT|nr:hypothetical protein MLD38_037112 [Melastoma candidum]